MEKIRECSLNGVKGMPLQLSKHGQQNPAPLGALSPLNQE